MANNVKFKIVAIVVVILVCAYGIVGLPKSTDELVENWKHNIHLGLDLKGGSQLVLQVQIQDAFKAEADSVIQRLKDQLTKADVGFGEMIRNEPRHHSDGGYDPDRREGRSGHAGGQFPPDRQR